MKVSVAKDFSRFPSGRYVRNGDTSGEAFRERFLVPSLREGRAIEVDLDGTVGYGSSFLEEAFGGTVRSLTLSAERVLELLSLKSSDPELVAEIREYIAEASERLKSRA